MELKVENFNQLGKRILPSKIVLTSPLLYTLLKKYHDKEESS